jgi:hypothetical protein
MAIKGHSFRADGRTRWARELPMRAKCAPFPLHHHGGNDAIPLKVDKRKR